VVAQVAAVDGMAALTSAIRSNGLGFLVKVNVLAIRLKTVLRDKFGSKDTGSFSARPLITGPGSCGRVLARLSLCA
jgi:hypothetical protein